ncbi:ABC transporter ATP-binding protein [Candidatus Riflebacteria bacterium]
MIKLQNIFKSFQGKKVLDGVSLEIFPGETFVILGPSGCGKSVLLKSLIGLVKPDRGKVYIEGEEISGYNETQLIPVRKKISMLFQNSALFDSMNVGDNVAFPLRQHTKMSEAAILARVQEKLELVGLDDVEELFPSELSGGMRKRVALARAISLDPKIILYDEPTTGLDPIMVTIIDELNKKLRRELGVTSVVVTHEISSAWRIADRLAVLYNGQVRQVGSAAQIRESKDLLVQQFIHGSLNGPIETLYGNEPSHG